MLNKQKQVKKKATTKSIETEEVSIIERQKLTVKENTEVFTILFDKEGRNLIRMGNVYPYEMDKLYPSSYGDYDSDHVWIDINGANYVIRKEDLL